MLRSRLLALTVALLLVAACAAGCRPVDASPAGVRLPPAGAAPDYQLGGAYEPAAEVGIVVRDRAAPPAEGKYSICYVNGFQTQPGEEDDWPEELLLHGPDGKALYDPNWPDEALLDTSTTASREAIGKIVAPWIESCARSGYDGVEFDNLDTYARTEGALSLEDNVALAVRFVAIAHAAGLAAGQKNAAEDSAALRREAGFDFAVAESCAAFDECPSYTSEYGEQVIAIEYPGRTRRAFDMACADPATPASVVLRDRELTARDSPDHVFALCRDR